MSETKNPKRPLILYSCYAHRNSEGEQFIPEHVFSFLISGGSEIFVGGNKYVFQSGDFRFFGRNQLARYTKFPPPGQEYQSISVSIDQATLKSLAEEHQLEAALPYAGEKSFHLQPHVLLRNYIDSLKPYLSKTPQEISPALSSIKVKEIVMILLQTNPALKDLLFDFTEPGKIDLEAYMNEHYKFNVEMSHFAYLTGRSLATFKRDFEKIFHTSPNRWLQKKRLTDAFYLLKEKRWKPSDVYLEVGFKDLSHFSFAFKKAFGMAPSAV